jgi:hypothetical protein
MIEVLRELDRALVIARAQRDPARPTVKGNGQPGLKAQFQLEPPAAIQRRVLDALDCEVPSQASFVARAELAPYLSVEDDEPNTRLVDLLCHLRHWAEANGADFHAAAREAKMHYDVERVDPYACQ